MSYPPGSPEALLDEASTLAQSPTARRLLTLAYRLLSIARQAETTRERQRDFFALRRQRPPVPQAQLERALARAQDAERELDAKLRAAGLSRQQGLPL